MSTEICAPLELIITVHLDESAVLSQFALSEFTLSVHVPMYI